MSQYPRIRTQRSWSGHGECCVTRELSDAALAAVKRRPSSNQHRQIDDPLSNECPSQSLGLLGGQNVICRLRIEFAQSHFSPHFMHSKSSSHYTLATAFRAHFADKHFAAGITSAAVRASQFTFQNIAMHTLSTTFPRLSLEGATEAMQILATPYRTSRMFQHTCFVSFALLCSQKCQ